MAAPGAKKALPVLRRLTISAPPLRVRSTRAAIRSGDSNRRSGIPPTVARLASGTMCVSLCAPITIAETSWTETPSVWAMKVRNRVLSSAPLWPITRSGGKRLILWTRYTMTSRGLVTTIRCALGDRFVTCSVTPRTMPALVARRSSRLIPGFRAIPATITTMSDCSVSSYPLVPVIRKSTPSMGSASSRSSALPCGMPSMTWTSTTSASRCESIHWAAEWPTFPAPTIVTFARVLPIRRPSRASHVVDDGRGKLAGARLAGAFHEARQIVGHDLLPERRFHSADDQAGRLPPPQVLEHHHARQDQRPRVHLVLVGVLGRGAVRRLEHRVDVADVPPGGHADSPDLGGDRVGEVVPVQVARGDDVEGAGPGEHMLERHIGDVILDQDLPGRDHTAVVLLHIGPGDRLRGELLARHLVSPLREGALRVLHDVALVDDGDAAAAVVDREPDGLADQPLGAERAHRLEADPGILADLPLELPSHELDQPLRLRRPARTLVADVDVLRVLAKDHDVHLLRVTHGAGDPLEVADRADAGVQVELLAQRHVEAPKSAADRRRQRPFDPDDVVL